MESEPTEMEERALDMFHRACEYLDRQFQMDWPRDLAQANLEARALLFNASNEIFIRHGQGISSEEVEGAQIIESNL